MARLSMLGSVVLPGAALLAPLAHACAETTIAVGNVPRLLEEAPQAKNAMQALQDEFSPRQREIVAQQKDLKAKEEKLQRDGAVMADNERRNAEKDLRDGQRDLQRKQNEFLEDLNARRNEEIGRLQNSLWQEVREYARGAGFDLVLGGDSVVYANDSMDITTQVLGALQTRFKATGATKPATPAPKPPAPAQPKQ